jgi:hypothetical protein
LTQSAVVQSAFVTHSSHDPVVASQMGWALAARQSKLLEQWVTVSQVLFRQRLPAPQSASNKQPTHVDESGSHTPSEQSAFAVHALPAVAPPAPARPPFAPPAPVAPPVLEAPVPVAPPVALVPPVAVGSPPSSPSPASARRFPRNPELSPLPHPTIATTTAPHAAQRARTLLVSLTQTPHREDIGRIFHQFATRGKRCRETGALRTLGCAQQPRETAPEVA